MSELNSFLFYNLFKKLQNEVGIELDQIQYEQFLECFLICKPGNKLTLLNLCKTLWLSRSSFRTDFEQRFETAYQLLPAEYLIPLDLTKDDLSGSQVKEKIDLQAPDTTTKKPPVEIKQEEVPTHSDSNAPLHLDDTEWKEVVLNIQEVGQLPGTSETMRDHMSMKDTAFLFSETKHLPFSMRKMQQTWRRFHGKSVFKISSQLNMIATIREFAKNGVLAGFKYQKVRRPCQRLIWLSDHAGDMVPFEAWDNVLYDSLKNNSGFEKANRYYFHCFPVLKLQDENPGKDLLVFRDRGHASVQSVKKIFHQSKNNVLVIIFSDGGAAGQRNEKDRLTAFDELYKLVHKKSKILWINPVSEWVGSAAGFLSLILPMTYTGNSSMQQAIKNL